MYFKTSFIVNIIRKIVYSLNADISNCDRRAIKHDTQVYMVPLKSVYGSLQGYHIPECIWYP